MNSVPIYKVTYTIDANGLRIAPPYDAPHVHKSVQFFGCSYIVLQAKEEAARQYPQSEFHVILWDSMFVRHDFLQVLPRVLDTFRTKQVRVHLVSEIIPDYEASAPNTKYEIHRYDNHPNPSTYRTLATYVAKNIVHEDDGLSASSTLPAPVAAASTEESGARRKRRMATPSRTE